MGAVPQRFSVVLPVGPGVDHAGRAAVSVLGQTFGDLELVVVHTDTAEPALEAVRLVADRRVRFVGTDDVDLTGAGLRAARGDRVAVLDTATSARPNWLARCGRLLDRSGADVVFCGGDQHHLDGTRSEILPRPHCLRPGAVVARAGDLAELVAGRDPLDVLAGTAGDGPRLAVHTPEALLDWYEQVPLRTPTGDRLRLRLAREAIEVLGCSPIPDVPLLARYATIGGVAAARLREHREARTLFALARRMSPGELKPFARWAVASVAPLSDLIWDPERVGGDPT